MGQKVEPNFNAPCLAWNKAPGTAAPMLLNSVNTNGTGGRIRTIYSSAVILSAMDDDFFIKLVRNGVVPTAATELPLALAKTTPGVLLMPRGSIWVCPVAHEFDIYVQALTSAVATISGQEVISN